MAAAARRGRRTSAGARSMTLRRIRQSLTAGCISIFLCGFIAPGTASAHAILDSSSPASSSVLPESPKEIRLDFNEKVEATLGDIRLFNSQQKEVAIDNSVRSNFDTSVVTAALPSLDNGVYVVVWRVVSADGHPATGAFPFEIGESTSGTADVLLSKVLAGIDSSSNLDKPMALMRLIGFLAVVVLIGFMSLAWGTALLDLPSASRLLKVAAIGLAGSSIGVLLLQGPVLEGSSWSSVFDSSLIADVVQQRLGIALLIRLVCVIAWGAAIILMPLRSRSWWQNLVVITSLITLLTFSTSGHASAGSLPILFIAIDVVHFAAISMWVGALICLAFLSKKNDVSAVAVRFSRMSTWTMPITVVTGVVQGLHLMGGISGITDSSYGKYLIAKTLLVAVIIAVGTVGRRRLSQGSESSISGLIKWESVVVILVLAVTSFLVASSPNSVSSQSGSFSATLVQGGIVADLLVTPTKVGPSEVHVILTPPGGSLSPVVSATVRFSLPSRDIPPIPAILIAISPNHWSGVVQFPFAGAWQMEVRVEPVPNQTLLFTSEVVVSN